MSLGAAIACGAALGLLLAVLGGGGSLFIMPVLIFGFRTSVATATGTSLVVVFAAASVGAVQHIRAKRFDLRTFFSFGPASMAGAALGALAQGIVSSQVVLLAFSALLIVAAVRMLLGGTPAREETERVSLARAIPLGLVLGAITGFIGVGGGFLILPVLVWGAKVALKEAIGTSTALIAVSCISGAVTHIAQGHVDLPLALTIGGGAIGGALVGAPLSAKLPEKPLRIGFGVLVLGAAIYTALNAGW